MKKDKYYKPKTKRISFLKYVNSDMDFIFSNLIYKDVLITKKEKILEYRGGFSFFDIEKNEMNTLKNLSTIKGVIRDDKKIATRIYSKSIKVE
ncbi:hypothetical protein LJB88_03675 [Erysipelotrichaceae bacterium OttesenSCG-928-M19]|nr:hypothetical protein [Erysipelotrichaceae bacterium OttesenSCG-928-M19]